MVFQILFFRTGLDYLHKLTTSGNYELRVDMEDFQNNRAYAKYRYYEGEDNRVVGMFKTSEHYSKVQQLQNRKCKCRITLFASGDSKAPLIAPHNKSLTLYLGECEMTCFEQTGNNPSSVSMDVLHTFIIAVKMFICFRNVKLHEASKGMKNTTNTKTKIDEFYLTKTYNFDNSYLLFTYVVHSYFLREKIQKYLSIQSIFIDFHHRSSLSSVKTYSATSVWPYITAISQTLVKNSDQFPLYSVLCSFRFDTSGLQTSIFVAYAPDTPH